MLRWSSSDQAYRAVSEHGSCTNIKSVHQAAKQVDCKLVLLLQGIDLELR